MLNIKSLTQTASYSNDGQRHEIDFGTIKKNSKAIVELLIDTEGLEDFKSVKTCGCSATDDRDFAGKTKTFIEYKDTNSQHVFAKTIRLEYGPPKNRTVEKLRITGEIK